MDKLFGIWVPAGIIFAFQIEMVRWRIDREITMESEEERTWLPVCDYLNLLSMIVTVVAVFVFPIALFSDEDSSVALRTAQLGFGLSAIFLVGYLFALIGHYRLFVGGLGPRQYLPIQELVPVALTGVAVLIYTGTVVRPAISSW